MQDEIKEPLLELCKKSKEQHGHVAWNEIHKSMLDLTGIEKSGEQWRSAYRMITGSAHKARHEKMMHAYAENGKQREVSDAEILSVLKVKREPQDNADILHMPLDSFAERIKRLKSQGYNISFVNHFVWLERSPIAADAEIVEPYSGEVELIFGVVSDTHLCNKFQQITYLNQFYDLCYRKGIHTVYHSGDISDGYYKNRPEHIYELVRVGFDEQADYIIQNYPKREGITTKFITGNHDATHLKNGGADIGRAISKARNDMQYLGYMSAKVWLTPQCDMDLFHPLDGAAYALSYPGQKYVDGLQGGSKPRILVIGHHHKMMNYLYRNIHVLEAGCFEAQTTFEKGKKISVNVGGWIIHLKCLPDGTITEFSPTFIPYYDMIGSDY